MLISADRAVASFFKPASQREPEKLVWRIINNSLVVGQYDINKDRTAKRIMPVKVAAFDLDDTIIVPTGPRFAKSATAWKWWDASVPGRLKALHEEGYIVVILSNQGNISLKDNPKILQKDNLSLANLKSQIASVFRQLDFPITIYAATNQDRYRKPRVGMWQEMLEEYDIQEDGAVDLANSFYVGDAAGRAKTDKRRKDHATSDRLVDNTLLDLIANKNRDLAVNIGIGFKTPEEFFLDEKPEVYEHVFEPAKYLEASDAEVTKSTVVAFKKKCPQELIIFCGSPGAGKSTFYWNSLQPLAYERVNQDILKSVSLVKAI